MSQPSRMILLVEDCQDDADLTLRAFRTCGLDCRIERASDGRQALEFVFGERRDETPLGLILLDLKLPCISGLDVLRELRGDPRGRHVPVVVMSCSTEHADISASYDLGANSYIHKPVDFDEFATAIGSVATYWLSLNELPPPRAHAP